MGNVPSLIVGESRRQDGKDATLDGALREVMSMREIGGSDRAVCQAQIR